MARSLAALAPAPVVRRSGGGAALLVAALVAAGGVAAAVAVELSGRGAFPTHPVSALALGAGAVAVQWAASTAPERSRFALTALAVSLLAYLWLGVAACASGDRIVAALWSAGWIPPNGLLVVVGLAVATMPRSAVATAAVTAAVTVGTVLLVEPTPPFTGLPTAAPEAWSTRVPWLADTGVTLFSLTLVAACVATVVRAVRAHPTERRHLVNCSATTSMGAGLVVMCLSLAALRDPGDVDPSVGSVSYLVAIAGTAVLAAYGNAGSRWPLRVVLGYWATALALLVGVQATRLGPEALGVALTVAVAGAGTVGTVAAVAWLERWLTLEPPHAVAKVPVLSPRENEVLSYVAAGATNAGIAAELSLSERTVEQHLRSIFSKLKLGGHDSPNRRVRAAAVWWQHQADQRSSGADSLA